MSGFRNFGASAFVTKGHTLASAYAEDDWSSDSDTETKNASQQNQEPFYRPVHLAPVNRTALTRIHADQVDEQPSAPRPKSPERPAYKSSFVSDSSQSIPSQSRSFQKLNQSPPKPQVPISSKSVAEARASFSHNVPIQPSTKPFAAAQAPVTISNRPSTAAAAEPVPTPSSASYSRSNTIQASPPKAPLASLSRASTTAASKPSYTPQQPTFLSSHQRQPSSSDSSSQPSERIYKSVTMGINTQTLAQKFPYFTASEIAAFHQQFSSLDKDGRDLVHQSDISNVSTKAGAAAQDVTAKLAQLSLVKDDGLVSFEAFLSAVSRVREDKGAKKSGGDSQKIVLHGHGENTTHTINEDEKESFTEHINQSLAGDKDVKSRLPIDPSSMQIFAECRDGLVLAKLINNSVAGTIDERVLNVSSKKLNAFQMTENNNVVVNSAKAIGCSVVNIGAQDLNEGREHLILGLIWQIIKIGLQSNIDIKVHPELFRLLENGESLEEFLKLPPDQILLRWFNYHLKRAGSTRKVNNFTSDIKDGENYTVLLHQLAPNECSMAPMQSKDLMTRAEQVLQNADKIGCRKYLSPKTLVGGNAKLNFAFVANLFNTHPGLEKLTEAEMAQLDEWLFSSEGDREARAFALWLNSLGIEPFVNNLYDDLRDGLILLQAMDRVHNGLVDWKKVNKAPVASKFKKVENTNYVVVLGKSMKFSLVGIQGSDLTDGNKTLTLGLVWQLMREHVLQTLRTLSSGGKEITDADMVKWANETVKAGGKGSQMSSFKDASLRTGHFFLDLLNSIKPGVVNLDLVTSGQSDDDAKMNAKYAISIARKLGATIFVLPEDIVEVKPKMILTFIGTLMALHKAQNPA